MDRLFITLSNESERERMRPSRMSLDGNEADRQGRGTLLPEIRVACCDDDCTAADLKALLRSNRTEALVLGSESGAAFRALPWAFTGSEGRWLGIIRSRPSRRSCRWTDMFKRRHGTMDNRPGLSAQRSGSGEEPAH